MADETTAILPNSYHSTQTENITQSDTHGTTEQTIQTETRRVIETTMRMEHKSPHPDIEINLSSSTSPHPIATNEHVSNTEYKLNSFQQQQHQHQQSQPEIQNHFYQINDKQYEPLNVVQQPKFNVENDINHVQSFEFDKKEYKAYNSILDRIKTIERPENLIEKPLAFSPSKKMMQNGELSYYESLSNTPNLHTIQPPLENGYRYESFKVTPVQETIHKISHRFGEYGQMNDLKAPSLVKQATPYLNGHLTSDDEHSLSLQPGEPPQMCFAPRIPNEEKQSMVERIEKSLERDLEKGPKKVLPHSVRTMPPSPQCVSNEMIESTKRSIMKYTKQTDSHAMNHLNNTFYEQTKPLPIQNHQLDTYRCDMSPIKNCEKVRFESSLFAFLNLFKCANRNENNPKTLVLIHAMQIEVFIQIIF